MLQHKNPRRIFSDMKERRKIMYRHGAKSNQRIAAHTGHCRLDGAICFETHQRRSGLHPHPPTSNPAPPALNFPWGKENVDSQKHYSKKIHRLWTRVRNTYSRSNSKSLMFGPRPFCLTLLRCQGVRRDWQVYSCRGVSGVIGEISVFAV